MKPLILRLLAVSAPLLAPAMASAAFNPALVAADARWVVHVDLVALRESSLGQALFDALQQVAPMMNANGLYPDFDKIVATAGTITAYGVSFSQDPNQIDGTLILQGTPELRRIAEGFIAQATVTEPDKVTEITGLPFEAYSLGGQATLAFPKEPVILFSKNQAQLVKAYDVFRGTAPSLERKSASVIADLIRAPGQYYFVAASEVPNTDGFISENAPQARILKMATAAALALGEDQSMTAARLRLVASTDDMAEKLDRILQGMTAILSLTNTDDQQLAEFLRSVTTERKGKQVALTLAYPSDRLLDMLQGLQRHATEAVEHHRGSDGPPPSPPAPPAPTEKIGRVVGEWHADAELGGASPGAESLTTRVFENVTLKTGATISVSGRRGNGEHARIDYVEFAAATGGGAPARYEAEFMRLENYQIEQLAPASGGELVRLRDNRGDGMASFRFQGADGTYRVTVGYVDENDGKSSFALGVQEATPVAVEAAP